MTIKSASDIFPQGMAQALLEAYLVDPEWFDIEDMEGNLMKATPRASALYYCALTGLNPQEQCECLSCWSTSCWLGEGPKIYTPSEEVCKSLAMVDMRIDPTDYRQPFDHFAVDLTNFHEGSPYEICFVSQFKFGLVCTLGSSTKSGNGESVSILFQPHQETKEGKTLEELFCERVFREENNWKDAEVISKCFRITFNSAIALTNFGGSLAYLLPGEIERDARLCLEDSERGERARMRTRLQFQGIRLHHEVSLHRQKGSHSTTVDGETGREVRTHWRRGHWANVAHGPQHSLRKLVFRPPVMVRADRATGDAITTHYH